MTFVEILSIWGCCRMYRKISTTLNREIQQGMSRFKSGKVMQKNIKLSDLTNDMLKRKIQPTGEFHCCEEDAVAALGMYDMSIF